MRKRRLRKGRLAGLILCLSLATFSFLGGFVDSKVEKHTIMHTVEAGDTLYDIAGKYYDLNKNGMCFNEFWYNVNEDNANLTANRRCLQVGDIVTVNYYTVTKHQ